MDRCVYRVLIVLALSLTGSGFAQDSFQPNAFSRKNTFTLFVEYSPTSSHILMGDTRRRILADFGGAYTRRIVSFRGSDLGYQVEIRPVLFESDPVQSVTILTLDGEPVTYPSTPPSGVIGVCQPGPGETTYPSVVVGAPPIVETYTITCGRQWTFGQVFTPVGFKYSMGTRHPLQPFLVGTLGYMYTSRPVPVADAESFNFVFDFGAGIELFRSETRKRSVSIEARYHHFSNRDTAQENPGTDNITYKLSYSFGH
jgi:hypothetical protein